MPEISRFFGIVTRMYFDVIYHHTFTPSMGSTKR